MNLKTYKMTKYTILTFGAMLFAVGLTVSGHSYAETVVNQRPGDDLKQEARKGWFFYKGPAKVEEKTVSVTPKPKSEPKKDPCTSPATWEPKCGFIEPGSDFEFQAKQRDALMQNMVMNPSDAKAVEAFQYYNKWVVDRATEVANVWHYNVTQNPKLDPAVNAPISQFGLQVASEVKAAESGEIFDYLAKNGMLLYFTRTDCVYCHTMAGIAKSLEEDTGIPLWDISLDDKCLAGFESKCMTAPDSIPAAQALQVATVPTVFLYIKPNTWIRVSTGVTSTLTLKSRIVSFVTAYRAAVLKGAAGDGLSPSLSFTPGASIGGNAVGVADGQAATVNIPTQAEIKAMLKDSATKP
jgi:hypothetical protein